MDEFYTDSHIRSSNPSQSVARGGSLLEVLVAVLVFAIGGLGIAALQLTNLVRADDTKQRSAVIWKAQELVDRIRANREYGDQVLLRGAYQAAISASSLRSIGAYTKSTFQCSSSPAKYCADRHNVRAAVCSPTELASFDVWNVFCDPTSGLSTRLNAHSQRQGGNANATVVELDLALIKQNFDLALFIEWVARSNDRGGLGQDRAVHATLCDSSLTLDPRLGLYCVIF